MKYYVGPKPYPLIWMKSSTLSHHTTHHARIGDQRDRWIRSGQPQWAAQNTLKLWWRTLIWLSEGSGGALMKWPTCAGVLKLKPTSPQKTTHLSQFLIRLSIHSTDFIDSCCLLNLYLLSPPPPLLTVLNTQVSVQLTTSYYKHPLPCGGHKLNSCLSGYVPWWEGKKLVVLLRLCLLEVRQAAWSADNIMDTIDSSCIYSASSEVMYSWNHSVFAGSSLSFHQALGNSLVHCLATASLLLSLYNNNVLLGLPSWKTIMETKKNKWRRHGHTEMSAVHIEVEHYWMVANTWLFSMLLEDVTLSSPVVR